MGIGSARHVIADAWLTWPGTLLSYSCSSQLSPEGPPFLLHGVHPSQTVSPAKASVTVSASSITIDPLSRSESQSCSEATSLLLHALDVGLAREGEASCFTKQHVEKVTLDGAP